MPVLENDPERGVKALQNKGSYCTTCIAGPLSHVQYLTDQWARRTESTTTLTASLPDNMEDLDTPYLEW